MKYDLPMDTTINDMTIINEGNYTDIVTMEVRNDTCDNTSSEKYFKLMSSKVPKSKNYYTEMYNFDVGNIGSLGQNWFTFINIIVRFVIIDGVAKVYGEFIDKTPLSSITSNSGIEIHGVVESVDNDYVFSVWIRTRESFSKYCAMPKFVYPLSAKKNFLNTEELTSSEFSTKLDASYKKIELKSRAFYEGDVTIQGILKTKGVTVGENVNATKDILAPNGLVYGKNGIQLPTYLTANRPTSAPTGTTIIDANLKKIIWYSATDDIWYDATGTIV